MKKTRSTSAAEAELQLALKSRLTLESSRGGRTRGYLWGPLSTSYYICVTDGYSMKRTKSGLPPDSIFLPDSATFDVQKCRRRQRVRVVACRRLQASFDAAPPGIRLGARASRGAPNHATPASKRRIPQRCRPRVLPPSARGWPCNAQKCATASNKSPCRRSLLQLRKL